LYLGIDQHARQITVSIRHDAGDVLLARQVSTQPENIRAIFQQLTGKLVSKERNFWRFWKSVGSTIGWSAAGRTSLSQGDPDPAGTMPTPQNGSAGCRNGDKRISNAGPWPTK